jgi:N utilization substance protein A
VDIIPWADDPAQLVANALSPAQVLSVEIDRESRTATAHVPENQLSLAIGKDGQNARLAAKLTGWRIDIKASVEVAAEPSPDGEELTATSSHPDPPPQAGEGDVGH